jgi:hypothetical protein
MHQGAAGCTGCITGGPGERCPAGTAAERDTPGRRVIGHVTRLTWQPAYAGDPVPLFVAAGVGGVMDDGLVNLDEHSAADFIARCAELRYWPRATARDKVPTGVRS